MNEQTSIAITSNKDFSDWTELLQDEAIATAILDRLIYRCQIFNLKGKSYRMEKEKYYLNKEATKSFTKTCIYDDHFFEKMIDGHIIQPKRISFSHNARKKEKYNYKFRTTLDLL